MFLKSTDDAMLETLEKLSGKTHVSLIEQKTITRDNEKMLMKNEGRISYTMSTKEKAVITFDDMLFIQPRNSIVFRAGGSPIWNRDRTILPMSWRLLQDAVQVLGRNFSLQTVPTLSTVLDFDVRKNQPDMFAMLNKRLEQARIVESMKERYQDVYDLSDTEMLMLDPDELSDEIMIAVNQSLYGTGIDSKEVGPWVEKGFASKEEWQEYHRKLEEQQESVIINISEDNDELLNDLHQREESESEANLKVFAGDRISRRMLVNEHGAAEMELQMVFAMAYEECHAHFASTPGLQYNPSTHVLIDPRKGVTLVEALTKTEKDAFEKAVVDDQSTTYSDETDFDDTGLLRFRVTADFIKYLAELPTWSHLAGGRFETQVGIMFDRMKT